MEIVEKFHDFTPQTDIKKTILRLIKCVPKKHMHGLKYVFLTNKKAINSVNNEAKHENATLLGLKGQYFKSPVEQESYITLFVDNIIEDQEVCQNITLPVILRIINYFIDKTNFKMDFKFSVILYREIGHHIIETQHMNFNGVENTEEIWTVKLMKRYFYRKYWYIFPFTWIVLTGFIFSMKILREKQ